MMIDYIKTNIVDENASVFNMMLLLIMLNIASWSY